MTAATVPPVEIARRRFLQHEPALYRYVEAVVAVRVLERAGAPGVGPWRDRRDRLCEASRWANPAGRWYRASDDEGSDMTEQTSNGAEPAGPDVPAVDGAAVESAAVGAVLAPVPTEPVPAGPAPEVPAVPTPAEEARRRRRRVQHAGPPPAPPAPAARTSVPPMTVGLLRNLLAEVDDDVPVWQIDDEDNPVAIYFLEVHTVNGVVERLTLK